LQPQYLAFGIINLGRRPIRLRLFGAMEGRQAPRGGDGLAAGPLEGKPSAQASAMKAHRGETPWVVRYAARQPDPASPGDAQKSVEPTKRLYAKPQKHKTAVTHLRQPAKPRIRQSDFVPMHESASTHLRQTAQSQTWQSVNHD
jgi:hypothetical protein